MPRTHAPFSWAAALCAGLLWLPSPPAQALAAPEAQYAALSPKIEVIEGSYRELPSSASRRHGLSASERPGRTLSKIKLLDEIMTTLVPDGVSNDEIWVNIDLGSRRLVVYRGHVPIKELPYVAFGTAGAQPLRLKGSNLTPTGEFRVDRINRQSRYHLFFGIDYPNKAVADQALAQGMISRREHRHIHEHIDRHGVAPADTSLGGFIGIHGLGRSSRELHKRVDWTQGCVAVTNEEITALSRYLKMGSRVVIRS